MTIKQILLMTLCLTLAATGCRDAANSGDDKEEDGTPGNGDGTGNPDGNPDGTVGTDTNTIGVISGDTEYPLVVGTADTSLIDNGPDKDSDADVSTPDQPVDHDGDGIPDNVATDVSDYPNEKPDEDIDYVDKPDVDYDTADNETDEDAYHEDDMDYPDKPISVGTDVDTGVSTSPYQDTDSSMPDIETPEDCYIMEGSSSEDWCDIWLECPDTWVGVHCYQEDDLYCYCDNPISGSAQYSISDISAHDACNYILEYCIDGSMPVSDEEPECSPSYESVRDDSCSLEYECSQSAQFDDGVSADISTYRYTYCWGDEDDTDWQCECNSADNYLNLSFETSEEPRAICSTMSDLCADPSGLTTDGAISCAPSSQSADDNWCDTSIECAQEAVIGDMTVEIAGWTWSSCRRDDDDDPNWECECGGGNEVSTFEITGDTGWNTCSAAADECIDMVIADGVIGGGGGGGGRWIGDMPMPMPF